MTCAHIIKYKCGQIFVAQYVGTTTRNDDGWKCVEYPENSRRAIFTNGLKFTGGKNSMLSCAKIGMTFRGFRSDHWYADLQIQKHTKPYKKHLYIYLKQLKILCLFILNLNLITYMTENYLVMGPVAWLEKLFLLPTIFIFDEKTLQWNRRFYTHWVTKWLN